jgi:serine/threonine-protein kinase HipA
MVSLDVRLEGFEAPAGILVRDDEGATAFAYTPEYLHQPDAIPLSFSLPLQDEIYPDLPTRTFFLNLLPENDQFDRVIEREGLDSNDVVGILYHLGSDCAGAVSCLPAGSGPVKIPGNIHTDYDPLSMDDLTEAVLRLSRRQSLQDELRDPSPVAGVRRKLALAYSPDVGFALPKPGLGVPTTHILKVADENARLEPSLERAAAVLALACGLDVVLPELLDFNGIPALLIPRFDRRHSAEGRIERLHQEDFAQALSLPPRLKYERRGSAGRRFELAGIVRLLKETAEPALSVLVFLRATFFNLAIGNSDNHAKNHALLYDVGPIPRLAPLYDLVPILLDDNYTHELAFTFGPAKMAEEMTPSDLRQLLGAFGFEGSAARRFVQDEIGPLIARLDDASARLPGRLKSFDDLIGRETSRLVDLLQLGIDLRERDYFQAGGGGWAMS